MPFFFFFFNDTATTEIYTLSLHDALPILVRPVNCVCQTALLKLPLKFCTGDRKSTRLNSSHTVISYAVFCLKKKKLKRPGAGYTSVECRCLFRLSHRYTIRA